jgi:predicted dehydrogenase
MGFVWVGLFRKYQRIQSPGLRGLLGSVGLNQRRSVPNFVQAVQWVHQGKLGKLQTMHASVYVPVLENHWLAP